MAKKPRKARAPRAVTPKRSAAIDAYTKHLGEAPPSRMPTRDMMRQVVLHHVRLDRLHEKRSRPRSDALTAKSMGAKRIAAPAPRASVALNRDKRMALAGSTGPTGRLSASGLVASRHGFGLRAAGDGRSAARLAGVAAAADRRMAAYSAAQGLRIGRIDAAVARMGRSGALFAAGQGLKMAGYERAGDVAVVASGIEAGRAVLAGLQARSAGRFAAAAINPRTPFAQISAPAVSAPRLSGMTKLGIVGKSAGIGLAAGVASYAIGRWFLSGVKVSPKVSPPASPEGVRSGRIDAARDAARAAAADHGRGTGGGSSGPATDGMTAAYQRANPRGGTTYVRSYQTPARAG